MPGGQVPLSSETRSLWGFTVTLCCHGAAGRCEKSTCKGLNPGPDVASETERKGCIFRKIPEAQGLRLGQRLECGESICWVPITTVDPEGAGRTNARWAAVPEAAPAGGDQGTGSGDEGLRHGDRRGEEGIGEAGLPGFGFRRGKRGRRRPRGG